MVDKAIVIIQARMNSERLPGKVMRKIGDKPMIGYLLDRLKNANLDILLATSQNKENDILVEYANENGVKVYRGSEDNVLERFYIAAKINNAKVIVRTTGDNPLTDGLLIAKEVDKYIAENNENLYCSTGRSKTFPIGISFEIFSFKLLEEAYLKSTLQGQFEHVTPYMHQNVNGNTIVSPIKYKKNRNNYRLTVDTQSDIELMEELILKHSCQNKSLDEIVTVLDNNPGLSLINADIKQRKWDSSDN